VHAYLSEASYAGSVDQLLAETKAKRSSLNKIPAHPDAGILRKKQNETNVFILSNECYQPLNIW